MLFQIDGFFLSQELRSWFAPGKAARLAIRLMESSTRNSSAPSLTHQILSTASSKDWRKLSLATSVYMGTPITQR